MIQFVFFALFALALLAWAFVYFSPSEKAVDPMKSAMEDSGYTSMDTLNRKRMEQLHILTEKGLTRIRGKIENLAQQQQKFLDAIQDQQQILKNTYQEASNLLMEARQRGQASDKDLSRLKDLGASIENDQRLLVAQGKDLIALNAQLTLNRQKIADEVNLSATRGAVSGLSGQYNSINDQAADLFNKAQEYQQKVQLAMDKVHDQMQDLKDKAANHKDLRQSLKDRVEQLKDSRQIQADQQSMLKQRAADQLQLIQDQRNR
jgi:vacuolar-type H+-ATPase subunit I/STV1